MIFEVKKQRSGMGKQKISKRNEGFRALSNKNNTLYGEETIQKQKYKNEIETSFFINKINILNRLKTW